MNTYPIVIGGGSGIGKAVCQMFAKEGARIAVVDMNQSAADKTTREISGI